MLKSIAETILKEIESYIAARKSYSVEHCVEFIYCIVHNDYNVCIIEFCESQMTVTSQFVSTMQYIGDDFFVPIYSLTDGKTFYADYTDSRLPVKCRYFIAAVMGMYVDCTVRKRSQDDDEIDDENDDALWRAVHE